MRNTFSFCRSSLFVTSSPHTSSRTRNPAYFLRQTFIELSFAAEVHYSTYSYSSTHNDDDVERIFVCMIDTPGTVLYCTSTIVILYSYFSQSQRRFPQNYCRHSVYRTAHRKGQWEYHHYVYLVLVIASDYT